MYILAGENQLTITKQNVYRDKGIGLILTMEVARDVITFDELETIINDIVNNAYDIAVYNDSDEKTAILSGFHCEPSIVVKGSVYTVELIDASENTFQIGRHKLMIEQLENLTTRQTTAINAHAETIGNQSKTIEEQTGQIISLEEQLATQDEIAIELYEKVATQEETIASQNEYIASLEEQIATQDEITIELYEAQAAQEQINAEQDEALIELYEMMGGN